MDRFIRLVIGGLFRRMNLFPHVRCFCSSARLLRNRRLLCRLDRFFDLGCRGCFLVGVFLVALGVPNDHYPGRGAIGSCVIVVGDRRFDLAGIKVRIGLSQRRSLGDHTLHHPENFTHLLDRVVITLDRARERTKPDFNLFALFGHSALCQSKIVTAYSEPGKTSPIWRRRSTGRPAWLTSRKCRVNEVK